MFSGIFETNVTQVKKDQFLISGPVKLLEEVLRTVLERVANKKPRKASMRHGRVNDNYHSPVQCNNHFSPIYKRVCAFLNDNNNNNTTILNLKLCWFERKHDSDVKSGGVIDVTLERDSSLCLPQAGRQAGMYTVWLEKSKKKIFMFNNK
ncbi:hypothetical protein T07_1281 [Trichinella nelsoni]|uniref:Uncharacterized protein n=1 Tax=Trichinella nelsoni TaxID=6336 RepID=A0A0V0SDZ2_9BILA|nr:hypothetical protein T07_1281 [Trichinella nelsoni]